MEALVQAVLGVFRQGGYVPIDPPVIQPADVFLNSIGEALRVRTYVFTDPEGRELCLRPDITVPACLHYLREHAKDFAAARYSYHGLAFRYQSGGEAPGRPREIWQSGIEFLGHDDREKAEAETLSLTLRAVEAAGLTDYLLRMGDIELFYALIDALEMPARWRQLLKRSFWRPARFQATLRRLSGEAQEREGKPCGELVPCLDLNQPKLARQTTSDFLEARKIPLIGVRTLDEITTRLLDQAADQREQGLSKEVAAIINAYLKISAPPRAAVARIKDLEASAGLKLGRALKACIRRLDLFAKKGIDLKRASFAGDFGRQLEYYSGFMFQIEPRDGAEAGAEPIAGGGRYDTLLSQIGAREPVAAVGCTIHSRRLLHAIFGVEEA